MVFKFDPKKKTAKKEPPKKPVLSEEQVLESNPDLEKLAQANKLRLRGENAKQKIKGADRTQIHFYTCLVFQSEKQKFEFLSHFPNVLCIDEVFIDGETFADAIGVKITPNELPPLEISPNQQFSELAKIP